MKNSYFFFLLFLLIPILSCDNDDDSSENNSDNELIEGSWYLTNVSGGLVGLNIDYTSDQVIWDFGNTDVVIENNIINNGPQSIYAGYSSGTYPYTLNDTIDINGESTFSLNINNEFQGMITRSNDTLVLDQGIVVDGILKTFVKAN